MNNGIKGFPGSYGSVAANGMFGFPRTAGAFNPGQFPGLLSWFQRGNPGTGMTWPDIAGGNDGTLDNATWVGDGVSMTGYGSRVNRFARLLSPPGSRTFCVWATNFDATHARAAFIGGQGGNGATGGGFRVGFFTSTSFNYTTFAYPANNVVSLTVSPPNVNERYMYAISHDIVDQSASVFFNGGLIATVSGLTNIEQPSLTSNGCIGAEDDDFPDENWNGIIDQVLIYTKPLTAAQIIQLFQEMP